MKKDNRQDKIPNAEEYFSAANDWYFYKYLYPITIRSFLATLFLILLFIALVLVLNLNKILPISTSVRYFVKTNNTYSNITNISRADYIDNNPQKSLNDILVRSYVAHRESYEKEKVPFREAFIANNSSESVLKDFISFMSIDNPASPKLKFSKNIVKSVNIISTDHIDSNIIKVKFESIAQDGNGRLEENFINEATVKFDVDQIRSGLPQGSRFYFEVTEYSSTVLKNRLSSINS